MERRFTILIADRNRHIRQFLKREFVSEGCLVVLAEDSNSLSEIMRRDGTLDLLILDDEVLALDESRMVEQLANRVPPLPFIIHSFSIECVDPSLVRAAAAWVEKRGNIEELKEAVRQVLCSKYPTRADPAELKVKPREVIHGPERSDTMGTRKG